MILLRRWLMGIVVVIVAAHPTPAAAEDQRDVSWLVGYEARALPAAGWTPVGTPLTRLDDGALTLADDSTEAAAGFETEWTGDLAGHEIIVEARIKVVRMLGYRNSPVATWPQRDGAPICVVVCDGIHEEGLLLTPPAYKVPGAAAGYVRTLTDRFHQADTVNDYHTYRLIIRGTDMAVEMDGCRVIEGEGAFWRPASSPRKFIRFGSTSKSLSGEAQW